MQGRDLGFIGGGRITNILLEAMRGAGLSLDGVLVSDANDGVRTRLAARFPGVLITGDNRLAAGRRIVFLALHPPALKEVLPSVATALRGDAVAVSLAPVLTFAKLRELLAGFSRLARVIPNAPSLVRAGFNPLCFAPEVPSAAREEVLGLLDVMGKHPEVPEETLEAYAILAAMGPTYFWFQWQTLRDLGRSFGLGSRQTDVALSAMIEGAAKLLLESGLPFDVVDDSIPVKPLAEAVPQIREAYVQKLTALFRKLKAQ